MFNSTLVMECFFVAGETVRHILTGDQITVAHRFGNVYICTLPTHLHRPLQENHKNSPIVDCMICHKANLIKHK